MILCRLWRFLFLFPIFRFCFLALVGWLSINCSVVVDDLSDFLFSSVPVHFPIINSTTRTMRTDFQLMPKFINPLFAPQNGQTLPVSGRFLPQLWHVAIHKNLFNPLQSNKVLYNKSVDWLCHICWDGRRKPMMKIRKRVHAIAWEPLCYPLIIVKISYVFSTRDKQNASLFQNVADCCQSDCKNNNFPEHSDFKSQKIEKWRSKWHFLP